MQGYLIKYVNIAENVGLCRVTLFKGNHKFIILLLNG
jgi:hypothetical protein